MESCKFSLIIPAYNRPELLRRAVSSCLKQNYADFEVLVADDASTAPTREAIADLLADPRVRYIRRERNFGMYPNWQDAIENLSTGSWILIVSDDDELLDENFLCEAARLIAANPKLVLVHADYQTEELETGERRNFRRPLPPLIEGRWYFLNFWQGTVSFKLITCLFKKSAADFRWFDHREASSCDWVDFLRLVLRGQVAHMPMIASLYRVHSGNFSQRLSPEAHLANLRCLVEVPGEYALTHGLSAAEVAAWKLRFVKLYTRSAVTSLSRRSRLRELHRFYRLVTEAYPASREVFFYPSSVFKMFVAGTPMFRWGEVLARSLSRRHNTPAVMDSK